MPADKRSRRPGEGVSRQRNRLVYSEQSYDSDIWRIDLQRPGNKAASASRLISSSQQENMPYFSPDGKKITFASNRSGSWEIWTGDSDGRNPLQLTSIGGWYVTGTPRWSSDGKLIAFDSRPYEASDIFVISPEGGSPRRLTTEPSEDLFPVGHGTAVGFISARTGVVREIGRFGRFQLQAAKSLYFSRVLNGDTGR